MNDFRDILSSAEYLKYIKFRAEIMPFPPNKRDDILKRAKGQYINCAGRSDGVQFKDCIVNWIFHIASGIG